MVPSELRFDSIQFVVSTKIMDENSTLSSTIFQEIVENVGRVTFSWYDYILFSGMLGVSALIGIYFGCFGSKQSTTDEYLMGDKKMKVFPISMSLVASHVSGITLLAVPADVYRFGASYWLLVIAIVIVTIASIYVFLPVFHKLQVTSTYEYLGKRFDDRTQMLASFLFALSLFLYLPIVIYIPALAFSAATGINVHLITPIVCGVCIFYTTIGGLKAVVWTDTLQFTVTIGAVITVFFLGVHSAGGFGNVWSTALKGHRLDIFDFDLDPTKRDSFWIVSIGITVGWLSMVGINQTCVQKFLSVPTLKEAKLCVLYFGIGICLVSSFSIFIGLIMYTRYAECDPFTTKAVTRNDQLLPYYIMDVASDIPGLSGLFIAGVFCAALSTLSASLNCLAGTVYEDFVIKVTGKVSESTASHILKLLVVVIGVICTGLVFIIEHLGGILPLAISLGGVTAGPVLGMFILGMIFPKAKSKGTFYGTIFAMIFVSWIVVMAQYYKAKGLLVYEAKETSIEGCPVLNSTYHLSTTPIYEEITTLETEIKNFTSFSDKLDMTSIKPATNDNSEKFIPFWLFRISYYYYTLIGVVITILMSFVFSRILKEDEPPVHRDLLSPVIYFLLPKEEKQYETVDKALYLVTTNDSPGKNEKGGEFD